MHSSLVDFDDEVIQQLVYHDLLTLDDDLIITPSALQEPLNLSR
jgi:hypothetical protein